MAMRIHQRYLMRETFAAIFLVLLAFVALFSFFDLINELRRVGSGGFQFGHAALLVALSLSVAPAAVACRYRSMRQPIAALSRYSTITRESNSVVPSSTRSTGTLPSGLSSGTRVSSAPGASAWATCCATRAARAGSR